MEWIFDKARPELATRMVTKMEGSEVVKSSSDTSKQAKKLPKAKAKAKAGNSVHGVDSFRLCSEEVITLHTQKKRVKTFADIIVGSASYVISLIDRDFSNVASLNLNLG